MEQNVDILEKQFIAILDFGSQYSQLIARRVRENGVFSRIVPHNIQKDELLQLNPSGIILSGGPSSVYASDAPRCMNEILSIDIPMLGICYGMQLMSQIDGGQVVPAQKREYGKATLKIDDEHGIFKGMNLEQIVWMSHGDHVSVLPSGYKAIAHTDNAPIAAMANFEKRRFGLQFHPEVVHTQNGKDIIRNFIFVICGCEPTWNMKSFIEVAVENIKKQVGQGKIICGLSGGVDSSVTARLIHEAVQDQLTCVFVNNGVLRKNEADRVIKLFRDHLHMNLVYADKELEFLDKLKGVADPEKKRKIIGERFIRVFEEEVVKIGRVDYLAQGTLYPDVIESVSVKGGPSNMIKSHHNVGGLPKDMKFQLVEPLKDLFKDEVRELGRELGIHDELLMRHPFPGPGLAVRVLGEVDKEKLDILREADAIVIEEFKTSGWYHKVWQAFAVLVPVKTVGVMGDMRTYEHVIALRVVQSQDGMTADWVRLPYELLETISNRIINEVRGVNRVVYDISSKPPSTIEWE
ncbi:MAG: glutamine-hydrolyzing GMP synthase [Chlamydiota bacterium]|nr:glutamine-hydrolyzing GMP synthase [Chlamydiota bacterium]